MDFFRDFSAYVKRGTLSLDGATLFTQHVKNYFQQHGREFAWRETWDPYHIVVSEVMLQQTQTERVKYKYQLFIEAFPSFEALAAAQLADVYYYWQGLGYNRRALALQKIAQKVVNEFGGALPQNPEILETFPGIGKATAASICAFAFNMPTVFIETNIRTVYIQSFYGNSKKPIHDDQIRYLVANTLDVAKPRIWYYALMDYGVMIKKEFGNPNHKSAHYSKQSKFEGSERQVRGLILRTLQKHKLMSAGCLSELINKDLERVTRNLKGLERDGLLVQIGKKYTFSGHEQ
jgi:A/G-specific adenine glycosylase